MTGPKAVQSTGGIGLERPFDIGFNDRGQAFVTGNNSNNVAILEPDGTPAPGSPVSGGGLRRPMGIAADSRGNMWVADFGLVDPPCPGISKDGAAIGGCWVIATQRS